MLNVVVTCTKEKRVAVSADCELRAVRDRKLVDRFRNWRGRLTNCKDRVPARDLYGGDHWAVAREISSTRFEVQTYVCSAGYGLIHIDDPIAPYSATFSRRHPDTVWQNSNREEISASDWWSKLCSWKGHRGFGPRCLAELATEYPQCTDAGRSVRELSAGNPRRLIFGKGSGCRLPNCFLSCRQAPRNSGN